jgi:hypothetical protein
LRFGGVSQGFDAAKRIFELSKAFPREETYSLTDQIRRASRSVCANLYLPGEEGRSLYLTYEEIIGTLVGMINHSETWLLP